MTNIDSILKSRDITLPTTVYMVKAMVFPVVMNRCESWTIKKIEYLRINAFEVWCWRRHLRVPWTARSNQSTLKEINPEYSLEGLMLKLNRATFDLLISPVILYTNLFFMVYLVPCVFCVFVLLLVFPLFVAPERTRVLCSIPNTRSCDVSYRESTC